MALTFSFPSGITQEKFLQEYWQKKPLLFKQCVDFDDDILTPETLAGLALEDGVEGRIIIEKGGAEPWEVKFSPFQEEDFTSLPESHWTLLVQDVDKHVPDIGEWLKAFQFIPGWRVDDVMVSFAQDQGGVGPHTDNYDVFLLQYSGKRRWSIHTQPVNENDWEQDATLKRLKHFPLEESWVLEPGDMLYLPPHVAHWGVAEGDCMTCSIGFTAPDYKDMLSAWCEDAIEKLIGDETYRDPPVNAIAASGEVEQVFANEFQEKLRQIVQAAGQNQLHWFAQYMSETKHHLAYPALTEALTETEFLQKVQDVPYLLRNPYARCMFTDAAEELNLFVNGMAYPVKFPGRDLLEYLTSEQEYAVLSLEKWLQDPEALNLLCQLYNDQHLEIDHD